MISMSLVLVILAVIAFFAVTYMLPDLSTPVVLLIVAGILAVGTWLILR